MNLKTKNRKRPLILVVDDEDDILELVEYNLKQHKFDSIVASNGIDCLKFAEEYLPDLIVLDVMMPRMGGIEACQKLRQNVLLKMIPVLMLTAKSDIVDHVQGLAGKVLNGIPG